jgi:hypothetical protein
VALVVAGSAAGAVPVLDLHTHRDVTELRKRLRMQFERSFTGIDLSALRSGTPKAARPSATTTATPSADPFPGLASGQFAGYGSGTVNHTVARLAGKGVDRDVNLATSHAAHSEAALPRWDSEIGRAAFPALAAGASHSRALAAELGEPGSDEEDSILPLEAAEAEAPPSSAPVVQEPQPVNVSPVLKNRLLRAEASARAIKTGCVLGTDLAVARANADDTNAADVKGDPTSTAPLLSLNGDDPPRGVAQAVARTRLTPIAGQSNRYGVLAETRQTIAPVTFFKGEPEELTIEVAGEWILRAAADGTTGSVTRSVENSADDDRPLMRIINRDEQGRKVVTPIGDLDELASLNQGGIRLSNGVTVVLGEPIRGLREETGTSPVATANRAAGALDILRLQTGDDPDDALARVGHMEAAVAVPAGGAACPGIAVTKRSSQPAVDAGGRFSWTLELTNPNDCVLDHVQVVDTTQPSTGLAYRVVATTPPAKIAGDTVTFDGIGPLPSGGTRALRIDVEVDPASAAGRFSNQAVATGACGSAPVTGAAQDETNVEPPSALDVVGRAAANEPVVRTSSGGAAEAATVPAPAPGGVTVRPAPLPSPISGANASGSSRRTNPESTRTATGTLANTGGPASGVVGMALCVAGVLLRRFRGRRRVPHPQG